MDGAKRLVGVMPPAGYGPVNASSVGITDGVEDGSTLPVHVFNPLVCHLC